MASYIVKLLKTDKKVLWLVCGGSNIPYSVKAMGIIRSEVVAESQLANLTISLTDERFGPVGFKNSNWQQLIEAGFDFKGLNVMPVLIGKSLEETTRIFGENMRTAIQNADSIVAQFGIGADGHIAGILPDSLAAGSKETAYGYKTPQFERITLTFMTLKKIDAAFAFVFGESKRESIRKLKGEALPLNEEPCQILKQLEEANIYSDCG